MLKTVLILATTLAVLPIAPAVSGDRALLIGINDYAIRPLSGPLNDLVEMRRVVEHRLGFPVEGIEVLANEEATSDAIRDAIETWLIAGTRPGDRVFLYFAGHGTQIDDLDGDEADGKDEVLVPIDFIDGAVEGDDLTVEDFFLTDDEIARYLGQLRGRKVTLVIDACNSGTIARSIAGGPVPATARYLPPEEIRGLRRPASLMPDSKRARARALSDDGLADAANPGLYEIWTAAASYQLTFERPFEDGRVRGVMSRALIQALETGKADSNRNGKVSREELHTALRSAASEFCANTLLCSGQGQGLTPQLEVPRDLRALEIAAWPGEPEPSLPDGAPAGGAPDPSITAPEQPSLETLTDLLPEGGARVSLALEHYDRGDRGPVRPGDLVAFEVTSEISGQVLLFALRADGEAVQLYPNARAQRRPEVVAHAPLRFPDRRYGTNNTLPSGSGEIVAVVVEDESLTEGLIATPRGLKLVPIPSPMATFSSLMERLSAVWTGDDEPRAARFGIARLAYGPGAN